MGSGYDVIFIGAGLANGMLALFLHRLQPHLKMLMLEKGPYIPAARTWCFHETDLTPLQKQFLFPIISRSWPGYEVHFPGTPLKSLSLEYNAIQPKLLEQHLRKILGEQLQFNAFVENAHAQGVILKDGRSFNASCVFDGRGAVADYGLCGYQKFVGLHVVLEESHAQAQPILMDATVEQKDGYRFMYVLPMGPQELLIEDTRYSSSPELLRDDYILQIKAYAAKKNWKIHKIVETESGVLPLPLTPVKNINLTAQIPTVGMAGGFFHPVTGYSLPDAVRVAEICAQLPELTSESVRAALQKHWKQQESTWQYLCLLNRMMFQAAKPAERYRIFQRFYKLPTGLIQRFYQGNLQLQDKVRLLAGKPPVPLIPAIRSLWSVQA